MNNVKALNIAKKICKNHKLPKILRAKVDEADFIGFVDKSMDALEKQIPKKLRIITNSTRCCPNCPKVYKEDTGRYCINCGQRLDWGNEDNGISKGDDCCKDCGQKLDWE